MKENLAEVIILHDSNLLTDYSTDDLKKHYSDFFTSLSKSNKTVHATFLTFGGTDRAVFENQVLADIRPGDFGTADGACPLYDSLVKTIYKIGVRYAWTPEDERPSDVIFASVCFGKENASKINTAEDVRKSAQHQAETYKWKFFHCTAEANDIEDFPFVDFIINDTGDKLFLPEALKDLSEKILAYLSKTA